VSAAAESDGTVRVRLDIAYDGTGFSGWAKQPGTRTVQGELERALDTVFRRYGPSPRLVVAGRTDAGVHAVGQVAHCDLTPEQWTSLGRQHRGAVGRPRRPPTEVLAHRLNGIAGLDGDVVVAEVSVAPEGFDARFSALWRRYRYRVADLGAPRDPLRRAHTLWFPSLLDADAMERAALTTLGLHDFATFCKPRPGATTVRTLQEFRWDREPDGVLVASLQADAFCHSMVRALVGAALAVGSGRLAADRMEEVRQAAVRSNDFTVAPAKGLVLAGVGYPPDAELAARAAETRARRDQEGHRPDDVDPADTRGSVPATESAEQGRAGDRP
jgi:tRNA pseudouridine38-40 synthase